MYNPVLCEYRQVCEDGRLEIKKCPLKFSWNNEKESCIPEEENTICHPNGHWSKQTGLDLTECIGIEHGQCRLGFTSFSRAQKYCENNMACVGIKEDPCNDSKGIGIPCIGKRWRPYAKIIDTTNQYNQIWTRQSSLPGANGEGSNQDGDAEIVLSNNWGKEKQVSYCGCPDGFYTSDDRCKTQFENQDQAMAFCEKNSNCSGVAIEGKMFVPIENIMTNDGTKISRTGRVIEKLNKIIQAYLDKRTAGNMLVEHWEEPIQGELKGCTQTEYGKCIPTFDNMFEAQYYCEGLGDKCSGVTQETNGYFTTRSGTEILETYNVQSWMKANWCSDYTPPLNMKLPSIFNVGNIVKIMWPVIVFNDLGIDMKRSKNENLNIVGSTDPLTDTQYKNLALKLEINADTIVFDGDMTLYTIKEITIKARKVIIRKKTKISFKQATSNPYWTSPIAPPPDAGKYDGENGLHGVDGFPGTILYIDAGCFVGSRDMLIFDIQSGSGSNGQHGSDGLKGLDGVNAPDSQKLIYDEKPPPREKTCKTFTSVCFQVLWLKFAVKL